MSFRSMSFRSLIERGAKAFGRAASDKADGAVTAHDAAPDARPPGPVGVRFNALVFHLGQPMSSDGHGVLHLIDATGQPLRLVLSADDLAELQFAIGPRVEGCGCADCAERHARAVFFHILRGVRRGVTIGPIA